MRQILTLLALSVLPLTHAASCCEKSPCCDQCKCAEKTACCKKEKCSKPACAASCALPKGDVLAVNTVEALFLGIQHLPCRHLTAECPDRCNHATDVAQFKVVKNLDYKKDGEYGDDKADTDAIVFVDVKKDIQGQSPAVAAEIKELKPGSTVELTITHVYVDDKGNRYPVRPATSFKVLDVEPIAIDKLPEPFAMPMAR